MCSVLLFMQPLLDFDNLNEVSFEETFINYNSNLNDVVKRATIFKPSFKHVTELRTKNPHVNIDLCLVFWTI